MNGSINGPFSSLINHNTHTKWQTVSICLTIIHSHDLTHLKGIKDRLTCKILQRDDLFQIQHRHYPTPLLLTVNKSWRAIFPAFFNQGRAFPSFVNDYLVHSMETLVSFSFGSIGATVINAKSRHSDSTDNFILANKFGELLPVVHLYFAPNCSSELT